MGLLCKICLHITPPSRPLEARFMFRHRRHLWMRHHEGTPQAVACRAYLNANMGSRDQVPLIRRLENGEVGFIIG